MRTINKAGRDLIKSFESLSLKAYRCPAGKLTIGWGNTNGVYEGKVITIEQAEADLSNNLQTAENAVNKLVKVPLNENEFAALVCFVFNIGVGAFSKSTLLKILNRNMHDVVPAQLLRWNKVNGEELGGLSRRRKAEAALWNTRP